MRGTLSRAFTSLPPRSPPKRPNGARAPGTVVSNGAAAPSSSSALSPPQAHASQAPAAAAASSRAAPGAGIFDGVHSIAGDLVDLLQRNGTFAFLEDLLQHYDCADQPAAAQPAVPSGAGGPLLPTRAQTRSLSTQAPEQRQRQTLSSAAQPPPRGIQADSAFPPGVFQLSGPAAH